MALVITLVICTSAIMLLREPIRRVPIVFYLLSLLIVAAGVYLIFNPNPSPILREFATIIQKGYVAFSLFALVMFIGTLSRSAKNGRKLIAIRSELSIMASILICGHFIPYLANYFLMLLFFSSLKLGVMFSLILSFALMLLLIPLAVTSIKAVRNAMKPETWKRLQKFSYLFFALVYFHLLGYLLVPMREGSSDAIISVLVYTLIFGAYLVLRVRREFAERLHNRENARPKGTPHNRESVSLQSASQDHKDTSAASLVQEHNSTSSTSHIS